jgi:hypothetical protein
MPLVARLAATVVRLAFISFICLVGTLAGSKAQGFDPIGSAFQGEVALGTGEMNIGRNMMPQGVPMPTQQYQLPPPVQHPPTAYAPNSYPPNYNPYHNSYNQPQNNYSNNGYAGPQGPVHLNPNVTHNVYQLMPPPPPPPPQHFAPPTFSYQAPITGFGRR